MEENNLRLQIRNYITIEMKERTQVSTGKFYAGKLYNLLSQNFPMHEPLRIGHF